MKSKVVWIILIIEIGLFLNANGRKTIEKVEDMENRPDGIKKETNSANHHTVHSIEAFFDLVDQKPGDTFIVMICGDTASMQKCEELKSAFEQIHFHFNLTQRTVFFGVSGDDLSFKLYFRVRSMPQLLMVDEKRRVYYFDTTVFSYDYLINFVSYCTINPHHPWRQLRRQPITFLESIGESLYGLQDALFFFCDGGEVCISIIDFVFIVLLIILLVGVVLMFSQGRGPVAVQVEGELGDAAKPKLD